MAGAEVVAGEPRGLRQERPAVMTLSANWRARNCFH